MRKQKVSKKNLEKGNLTAEQIEKNKLSDHGWTCAFVGAVFSVAYHYTKIPKFEMINNYFHSLGFMCLGISIYCYVRFFFENSTGKNVPEGN